MCFNHHFTCANTPNIGSSVTSNLKMCEHVHKCASVNGLCILFVCTDVCFMTSPQENEWLSGFADEPLCTVLSNNHNFHLTGKWYDERCSESGYGFVCQKPQGKIPSLSFSLVLFCRCLSLECFSAHLVFLFCCRTTPGF